MKKLVGLRHVLLYMLFLFLFLPVSVQAASEEELRYFIENYYVDELDKEVLQEDSISEIMDNLDPYSNYFTEEEYNSFINAIELNYTGVGVVVESSDRGIVIVQVFDDSPAQAADIQVGDIIQSVDGMSIIGKSIEESTTLVKGKTGTEVELGVLRPSTDQTFTVKVTRKEIHMPTVEYVKLGGNIGYVRLNSFNEEAPSKIKEAIRDLGQVNGWIFDLRDNGGGYLSAAQEIAGLFPGVENALLVEERSQGLQAHKAIKQTIQFTKPIHLLINEFSASASELIAGAVKDYDSATLYGQTTFGKGLAQTTFPLADGSVLKLSVFRFYTPKGNVIQEVGVAPDVETEKGFELVEAHRDLLTNNALPLDKLENVARDSVFNIEVAKSILAKEMDKSVSLIEVGGNEVEISVTPKTYQSFIVQPEQLLNANSEYILLIRAEGINYFTQITTSAKTDSTAVDTSFFNDVEEDKYFADPISLLYQKEIINGVGEGRFAPFHYLTRKDAAVMFARALELNTRVVEDPGFSDVSKGTYYYGPISAMKKIGVVQGKSAEEFGVNDILTREQMAGLVARAFNLEKKSDKIPFKDIENSFFKDDIMRIYQSGIAHGYTATKFGPKRAVTRGEFATFLYRALVNEKSGDFKVETVTVLK